MVVSPADVVGSVVVIVAVVVELSPIGESCDTGADVFDNGVAGTEDDSAGVVVVTDAPVVVMTVKWWLPSLFSQTRT